MARCRSWRLADGAHTPVCPPPDGRHSCHRCWSPCRATTEPGTLCADCEQAILASGDTGARAALAANPRTAVDVLDLLADDGSITVQAFARDALARRRPAPVPHIDDEDLQW